MPKVKAKNPAVSELKGLHLFHAGWSNCSMRVRMTLEEKKLSWMSHHLNTRKGEHITPEYFAIHPHGLVPALVHDGEIWIESHDIIRYLDEVYPEPRLSPVDEHQLEALSRWTSLASTIHVSAVKTYVYGAGQRNSAGQQTRRRKTLTELEAYSKLQTNNELLAFHKKSASAEGITDVDRENAEKLLHKTFSQIDAHLAKHKWLVGDEFTLADITWVPLQYTLEQAGFSFEPYIHVINWIEAVALRPSFQKGVVQWFKGPTGT